MVESHVTRNAGHPWTAKGPWDLLEVRTTTQLELDDFIRRAEGKFWCVWLRGHSEPEGQPSAALYKPAGARKPWRDAGPDTYGQPRLEWGAHQVSNQ